MPSLKEDDTKFGLLSACIIGLAAGLSALALESGVWYLSSLRVWLSSQAPAIIVLPTFGLIGGLISGYLVQRFSPTAYGSGIPQVRAYLLGAKLPLDIKVAAVKLFAGTIALGSGLFLGREGPTVHIGAAIAAHLNRFIPCSKERTKQLVAAGSGAGLAAAFNAPIAGVLFVVEELLKDTSTPAIGTAIIACFVASIATHLLNAPHVESALPIRALQISFTPLDIAFWVILGIAAGILGSIFNKCILLFLKLYRDYAPIPICLRVGFAGLISGLIIAFMPDAHFRNYATLNDMIIAGQTAWYMVPLAFCAFFFLTLMAYGSSAPGGLFAPAIVLGSALGATVSYLEHYLFGVGSAETMALVGMGAFFAAVARVPITAVVIIFEISGHYALVLPLMIACAVATFVGARIDKRSVYDMLRQWSGLSGPDKELLHGDCQSLEISSDSKALLELLEKVPLEKIVLVADGKFVGYLDRQKVFSFLTVDPEKDFNLKDLVAT
ncbi:MAG: ClC family H(+)/Cl(-) exchange transporter [Candidatus Obscuribacterales bacterium]|nr:ClC family H(+)/Cl(-) exchange transporter [Candidatus Obscuribacterales bacterium]